MSVSVSMPQLGESVTEGTVTRWLKREGEHVQADEPLLEVSTDKVDTEIPSPVSGILRGIAVAEDETVAVGAELAIIDEDGSAVQGASAAAPEAAPPPPPAAPQPVQAQPAPPPQAPPQPVQAQPAPPPPAEPQPVAAEAKPAEPPAPSYAPPAEPEIIAADTPTTPAYEPGVAAYPDYDGGNGQAPAAAQFAEAAEGPYVTPLVRKLAAEHGIDLASVTGTGVGGRIRKQDILDAAALQRGPIAVAGQPAAQPSAARGPVSAAAPVQPTAPQAPAQPAAYQAAAPAAPA